jgi:demethoxyubiquinone hydroxylase (CLK1/Coq7/Cat5 family)
MDKEAFRRLVSILRRAHAGELGASLAYEGHSRSLADPEEAREVLAISGEEREHRSGVRRMLEELGAVPAAWREALFWVIGAALGRLCGLSGWLAPMYAAGWLESGNIREYEEAAGLAIATARSHLAPELLRMAEVEWEHERYFRKKVMGNRAGRFLPLWTPPPPKESIGPKLPGSLSGR